MSTDLSNPVLSALSQVDLPLGPLDGRYKRDVAALSEFLSEAGLNKTRIRVEVEWFLYLATHQVVPGVPQPTSEDVAALRAVVDNFGPDDIAELAELESQTAHDVKAVEYYLKRRIAQTSLKDYQELVHFCCTSEDINNLSYALMVHDAMQHVWLPAAREVQGLVQQMAQDMATIPMLSRTHGQAATPTTMGKEFAVIAYRLQRQVQRIERTQYLGKINGATGTYGAHYAAVPQADWVQISQDFVTSLGLTWNPLTTQIESHDWQAELYSDVSRINRILHNLCTDMWTYISLGYFAQNLSAHGSTGSSTMPHKVNPIRFENAEANLEVSCALLDVLASTLVTSRMQRDLTDSSMQRNIGLALGHSLLALSNIKRGLGGVSVNPQVMHDDLDVNWEVLGEPVQSAMRAAGLAGHEGMDQPYERLKDLTRGKRINQADMREFIANLGLPSEMQERLMALTPASYIGVADTLVALVNHPTAGGTEQR